MENNNATECPECHTYTKHDQPNLNARTCKTCQQPTTENVKAYRFSESAKDKPILKRKTIKDFLAFQYQNAYIFGTDNLMSRGEYRLLGWAFDFKPYLTRYVYKQYGNWNEAYAPNKTILRKVVYGRIDEIR